MIKIKVQYEKEKNDRASRKIISYKILRFPSLKKVYPVKTVFVEGKDYLDSFMPLEQVTEADIPDDADFVQRISKDATVLEFSNKGYDRFITLFNEGNAFIYDEWRDVPALELGD